MDEISFNQFKESSELELKAMQAQAEYYLTLSKVAEQQIKNTKEVTKLGFLQQSIWKYNKAYKKELRKVTLQEELVKKFESAITYLPILLRGRGSEGFHYRITKGWISLLFLLDQCSVIPTIDFEEFRKSNTVPDINSEEHKSLYQTMQEIFKVSKEKSEKNRVQLAEVQEKLEKLQQVSWQNLDLSKV